MSRVLRARIAIMDGAGVLSCRSSLRLLELFSLVFMLRCGAPENKLVRQRNFYMRRLSSLIALLVCSTAAFTHAALAQAPQKKTLPNGLTVLVQENHAAPVVAVRFY